MFLFFNDKEEDFGYMMEGYKNRTITEERLNDALHRILGVKAALNLQYKEGGGQADAAQIPSGNRRVRGA